MYNTTIESNLEKIEIISNMRQYIDADSGITEDELPIVPQEIVDTVKENLDKFWKQPDIFPTFRDTLQLEYKKEDGDYLEFEIYSNMSVSLFRMHPDESEEEDTFQFDTDRINDFVKKFFDDK